MSLLYNERVETPYYLKGKLNFTHLSLEEVKVETPHYLKGKLNFT